MATRPTRAIEILAAIVELFWSLVVTFWQVDGWRWSFDIIAEEPIRELGKFVEERTGKLMR